MSGMSGFSPEIVAMLKVCLVGDLWEWSGSILFFYNGMTLLYV
jgi:hypothetical protein